MLGMLRFLADENAGKQKVIEIIDGGIPHTDPSVAQNNVINYILYVAGILAVVMIVVAGVQMTTSGGDPGKVAKAKQTIVWSVVGLIVTILAYAIVNFVVGKL